jgi:fructose-specific phosphotransferase system IIA component
LNISELISKETIHLNLEAETKTACIEQMGSLLSRQGYVTDAGQFVSDVLKREETSSTGIGFGVAIPHGKSAGVGKPGLAFAKFAKPVEWNSLDQKPVTMAFLIGVPLEQAGQEHLKILTTLARKLIHESFREQLQNAATEDDILKALQF